MSSVDLANHLWNTYLGGSHAGVPRPFGDAVLDSVDFYVDRSGAAVAEHYDELARRLHSHTSRYRGGRPDGVTLTVTVRVAGHGPHDGASDGAVRPRARPTIRW
jgi:chitinase